MPSIDEPVRLDTRLAGQLRRYHTWPIIGQQTVAEHTWQMLRIFMCVVRPGEMTPAIMFHIIFHDIGEHATGDLPYPIKRDNPDLKTQVDMVEKRSYAAQLDHWSALQFPMESVTPHDLILIKQIELVEMAEFGLDQMCLGNQHGAVIANRCLEAVYKIRPQPCPRLIQYVITRLRLFYRQYNPAIIVDQPLEPWWMVDQWRKLHESQRETSGGTPLQE